MGVCALAEDGTLYVTQDEDLIRYTKAGGYSDPETVAQQVTQLSQAYGRIYYIRNSGDTFELGVAGDEGILPTAGLSTYESTLFSYQDGTLYAQTYKDRYEGDTLTWGAPGEDWYEITAGVQSVARMDDRLVIMTTDVRESSQGGYRLFSYEDGQLKVIANGVSGFCCPLAQQPVQIYP